jgi:hypothetical protein
MTPSLSTFQEDQARVRQRIAMLEQQADQFTAAGKVVPASAHLRTARLLRWMWCIE